MRWSSTSRSPTTRSASPACSEGDDAMLLRLAWRNIWRNRRRTIISLLAVAMGVMAIVALHSFQISANVEIMRAVTRGLVGDLQVHGVGYQDSPDMATV